MILGHSPPCVDTTEDRDRQEVLDDADQGLEYNEDHRGEAEDTVRRDKMWMVALVQFDDDERTEEAQDAG